MSTEDKSREDTDKSVEPNARILDLCEIILVYQDYLDDKNVKEYIDDIIKKNVEFSGDKYYVRSIIQPEILHYIECAPSPQLIFAFGTDLAFYRFRNDFREYYKKRKAETLELAIEDVSVPVQLEYLFDYIQETIDFRRLHEILSFNLKNEIAKDVTKNATEKATEAASEVAVEKATEVATKAVKNAKGEVINAGKSANKKLQDKVNDEIYKLERRVSETSVTILGMFSGIVLTVVAGLFYSSSVLESVSQAEIYRLLAVAAVVGIVCFDLVTLMFMYINRIRGRDRETPKVLYSFVAAVNILLIALMIFSLYKAPELIEQEKAEPKPTPNQEIEIYNEVELGRY